MHETNMPQWKWPLVKVEDLIVSNDEQVRVARVRNVKGHMLERAVCHLVPLEATC